MPGGLGGSIVVQASVPPTLFAPAVGARLAYQVFGSGEHTMVAIPPTAQNIEVCWDYPAVRAMLEWFGSFCRYLHFDKRGTGCSDRTGRIAEIDQRVDDLRAVMDHAGIDRAHLLGASEGGPMTLLFAATYPQRVQSIVLLGSGAYLHPADLGEQELAELREHHRRYAAVWGTTDSPVAAGFAPSQVAADPGFAAWHQRYERLAASQDALLELLELGLAMDVREILPQVQVPVLLLHRTGDRVFPVERARETAALLPDARLFEQPGMDHFGYAGDVAGWMREVERFVTGTVRTVAPDSVAARPRVTIRTLGRFTVEVDDVELAASAWGSRLARTLCKRLVAARGWPVTRDELFTLLWPDETDRRRLGARLSVQLSTVRRILHGGVRADRDSVRLDLDELDTDLEALYRATDPTQIVAAYPGAFLPEDLYDAWTQTPRTEAAARFALAAREQAHAALSRGDAEAAIHLGGRLLEVDPYDADAHRVLTAGLLEAGNELEARRAHERWSAAMREVDLPAPPPLG